MTDLKRSLTNYVGNTGTKSTRSLLISKAGSRWPTRCRSACHERVYQAASDKPRPDNEAIALIQLLGKPQFALNAPNRTYTIESQTL